MALWAAFVPAAMLVMAIPVVRARVCVSLRVIVARWVRVTDTVAVAPLTTEARAVCPTAEAT